jgi:hypothetical protein
MIRKPENIHQMHDNDLHKGACEEDGPFAKGQNSFKGQLSHRESDPLIKASDTDFPEPGENPEHSGEPQEAGLESMDLGERPRRNVA